MSAPRALPMCPICGDEPIEMILGSPGYAANVTIACYITASEGRAPIHSVRVSAKTRSRARALWCRLAGVPT